jgi:hypothetical protein
MTRRNKLAAGGAALAVAAAAVAVAFASPATDLTGVPTANTKSQGYAPASMLSPELEQIAVAQGSTKVENPDPATISYYGYDNDKLNAAGQPIMVASAATGNLEAHKTEPDKNVYLVFDKALPGADSTYSYGKGFLFQGHESSAPGFPSSLTRINLDADAAHKVTVLATKDTDGNNIANIDGITWDPFAQKLLLTTENANAPTYSATTGFPSQVANVSGALGRGGYEGIQDDEDGNIWIVEDISGATKAGSGGAKRPNSFVYRYVPAKPGDLANGKLQVLQVLNGSTPITFASQAGVASSDQVALHTYGNIFNTKWVTIHDTAVDGTASFNANDAAKAHDGTPFKRPENGQFRPGGKFQEFYFDETGDTTATSAENSCCGGWTAVMRLTQTDPSVNTGKLTMIYSGDAAHAGFDNVAFFTRDLITFVEDAGAGLHNSRNALDSGFILDVTKNYANPANVPLRWLAEGRDPSATLDADNGGFGPPTNEDDNEITGIHVSDGNPGKDGILGTKEPHPFEPNGKWRVFYTQQHGDNTTWEVVHPK